MKTLKIAALLALLTTPLLYAACTNANAAPPSGDYTSHGGKHYFASDVNVDGTLTAAGLDCSETRSWVGGAISLNASSNYAVNVATGTSTGTVTVGGSAAQTIAIGTGAAAKTVSLGSATSTSSTAINAGTGDLSLTSVDDVTINGGSAGSIIAIGTNTHGNVFNIGTDDTNADTINIGSAKDTTTIAGAIVVSSTKSSGSCTLGGESPSVCTATVKAGAKCVCSLVGATAAIAAKGCAVGLSGSTLTITSANGATDDVNYHCF